jgi:predicted RNase H-like HicB family nuclease
MKEYSFPCIFEVYKNYVAFYFSDLNGAFGDSKTLEQAYLEADNILKTTIKNKLKNNEEIPIISENKIKFVEKYNKYTKIFNLDI